MKNRAIAPYIVGVGATLVLLLVAYMTLFLPRIHDTQEIGGKTAQQASANAALETKITAAKATAASLPALQSGLADFQKAFPAGAAQEDLIASVMAAAAASGVNVSGISPTAPSTATTAAGSSPAAGAAPAAGAPAAGSASPAPQTATAGQDSGTADPALQQVKATGAKAAAGSGAPSGALAQVGLTVSASGAPAALQQFVKALEQMQRPILVKSLSIVSSNGKSTLSLVGTSWFSAPLTAPKAPAAG